MLQQKVKKLNKNNDLTLLEKLSNKNNDLAVVIVQTSKISNKNNRLALKDHSGLYKERSDASEPYKDR